MSTRLFRHLMLGTVVLGLAASPALAQSTGGADTESGSSGGGGLTGQMTTTPQAKSDDAIGTRGETMDQGDLAITPDTAGTGERDCTAEQKWDELANACVEK
jgi:hypothetical protein